jgi:putative heme iron utilization protein
MATNFASAREGADFPVDSSNEALARRLVAEGGAATLATLDEEGAPFASYVVTAPANDLSPLLFLSRLAVHSRNLERDARASLLLVREPPAGAESLAAVRLTLTGRAVQDADPALRRLYLERRPDAARYADFADFSLYRFEIAAGYLVAGFGRIVALSRQQILGSEPVATSG